MSDGMDEYIFKCKMIDYEDKETKETLNYHLHQAVLGGSETIDRKIFASNLEKKIKQMKKDMGIDIRKMIFCMKAKRILAKAAVEEKVPIKPIKAPSYMLTTESTVPKM